MGGLRHLDSSPSRLLDSYQTSQNRRHLVGYSPSDTRKLRMGSDLRCLTLALAEPSCRMGQRLRLPTSATLRMPAAVHGDGRRGTLRDRAPRLPGWSAGRGTGVLGFV